MDVAIERRVAFEGAINFRDIGGYPVGGARRMRWGKLFRSDNLGGLSNLDLELLSQLNLRAVIDFRLSSERLRLPSRLPRQTTLRTYEIGFIPEGTIEMLRAVSRGTLFEASAIEARVIDQYRRFATDHNAEYKAALAILLDPDNQPLLMHCTSGKDRTGFAIAIVLMAVGAAPETILEDYLLTNRFQRDISQLFSASTPPAAITQLQSAKAAYLEAAFDQIQLSYGSIDAYLERALDLDDAKRTRLTEMLTERTSAPAL